MGGVPPDQQARRDLQFSRDPATVSIVTCSAKWVKAVIRGALGSKVRGQVIISAATDDRSFETPNRADAG